MRTSLPLFLLIFTALQWPLGVHAQAKPGFDAAAGVISDARWRSGIPLGGIGVGKIELLTDGSFGNFTINHNWDRPYGWAKGAFAAVRTQTGTAAPVTKMLRLGSGGEYQGVANVQHTRTTGWFPRARIVYGDDDLPVQVTLEAFSTLIPHDIKDSALPVACLTYTVTNPTNRPVQASLLLAWPNLLGWGGRLNGGDDHVKGGGDHEWNDLSGDTQAAATAGELSGLRYTTDQRYTDGQQDVLGEYFVGGQRQNGITLTSCPEWDASANTPVFWAGFAANGHLEPLTTASAPSQPAGAVSAGMTLAPGQSRAVRFYVAWAMPHHMTIQDRSGFAPAEGATDVQDRWTTNYQQKPGNAVTVDLGRTLTPTRLTLDQGTFTDDYPRGLRVEVSSDRLAWQQVAVLDAATVKSALQGGRIAVSLQSGTGRYLKLTGLGEDSYYWWSIHALSVAAKELPAPLTLVPTQGQTVRDVGHYWQNWWHSAGEMAAYVDANQERLLRETRAWQEPVRASSLPFWLKLKLINCAFPLYSNTVLTRDGRFAVQESPHDMAGALGTMDQRMASHAYYTAFFPELDRAELEMYAQCQQSDGRITHLDGNLHNVIGDPNVVYGITDWPDLSSSWVMQITKLYRWTGDTAFLARMQPHLTSAMQFLRSGDHDGDAIPEGGSTYDYEDAPPGAFIYSADCYLGALRAAASLASPTQAQAYDTRLDTVQQSVMRELWNGTYFRKWYSPATGKSNDDSFVAALAGDWLAHLTGLPQTLPPGIAKREVAQILLRHQKPFFPVPPMEVKPDGTQAVAMCFLLQHEPYLGCEAIYQGYVDDGLETLHRVYDCAWEVNHSPWDESLMYPAPEGRQGGLVTYMTATTSWHVLNALGGTSLDLPAKRLYVSPRLRAGEAALHIPVYFSRFWGWLDYVPAAHHLTLRIDRVFPSDAATQKSLYRFPGTPADAAPTPLTLTSVAADGDTPPVALSKPFLVRPGATLDLSPLLGALGLPRQSETPLGMEK